MKVNSVHIVYNPVYWLVHGEFWLLEKVCWDVDRKLHHDAKFDVVIQQNELYTNRAASEMPKLSPGKPREVLKCTQSAG